MARDSNALSNALSRLVENRADEDAWRILYKLSWPRVMATAYRMCRGRRDFAEDVSQEVFLRLLHYSNLRDFASTDQFQRYLTTLVVNAAHDMRKKDRDSENIHGIPDELLPQPLWMESHALKTAETRDLLDKLSAKLGSEDNRLMGLLAQGFSLGEIAKNLGITYSAAGVRVHRIRRMLSKLLIKMER